MTLALTAVRAYGIEVEEPVNKRYLQRLILTGTGANTDATHDYGNFSGTFWTAVGATSPGTTALAALKDILRRAMTFNAALGIPFQTRARQDASRSVVSKLDSSASAGGNATETLTVTGLLTTDEILGCQIVEDGANPAYIQEAAKTCATNGQYVVTFSTDPGAGLELRVIINRTTTTPDAGGYQLAMNGTNTLAPDVTFASGDAPTAWTVVLEWTLNDAQEPVEVYAAA